LRYAEGGEHLEAQDGVFVGVDGAAFDLDGGGWDVPFFEQPSHPDGLGSPAFAAKWIPSAGAEYQRGFAGAIQPEGHQ